MSLLQLFRSPRPTAERQPPVPPLPVLHRSPAFAELWRELRSRRRSRVLDLGAASSTNFEYLKAVASRIHIADLPQSLAQRSLRSTAAFRQVLEEALPAGQREWDVILGWDLLNYLSREEIGALTEPLARLATPSCLFLVLLSFEAQISAEPLDLIIASDQQLSYRARGQQTRPSPRYTSRDVTVLSPGFSVERSFLMQHGFVEYLLRRTS